jgi:hypothetical protein
MECGHSTGFDGEPIADADLQVAHHASEPLEQEYQPEGSPMPPTRVDYRVNRPGQPATGGVNEGINTTETSGLAK